MCTSRCPHALPRVAPNHTCLRTVPFSSCRNLTSIRVRSARRDAATSASSCPRQRSSPSPEQLASRSGCTGAVAQHDDDHISRLARDPRVRLVGALAAVLWPWLGATSAQAHIPLTPPSSASRPAYESLYEDSDSSSSRPSQSELALRQLGGAPPLAGPSSRTSGRGGGRDGGAPSTASRAAAALQLLASAREAVDGGQHEQALSLYGKLVSDYPDLALAEYGRIGRALMLYQVGRTSDAILALEDEEAVLRGAAEVHAALAALMYAERPSLALRAEEEWNLACAFDKRYSDLAWVRTAKHWPPRALDALNRFLTLT